jgi:hypothetical protein
MPTVHREHGMSFVVYTDDHPPPHVHVTGRGTAKITLTPIVGVLGARGMSKADTARALAVVKSHRDMMLDAWDRIHG